MKFIVGISVSGILLVGSLIHFPTAEHRRSLTGILPDSVVAYGQLPVAPTVSSPTFEHFIDAYLPAIHRNNFVVNIGAHDGKTHDPTYPLFKDRHFEGLLFEGHNQKNSIEKNLEPLNPRPNVSYGYVSPTDILPRLAKYNVPKFMDALKVDIDSFDAQLLEVILGNGYRPRVIMVEVNPDIPPPFSWSTLYGPTWNSKIMKGVYGASVTGFHDLLTERFGYGLVSLELENTDAVCPGCEHNMWFVTGELLERSGYRLNTFAETTRLFWETMFGTDLYNREDGIRCLHRWGPCPNAEFLDEKQVLNNFSQEERDAIGTLENPVDRATAISMAISQGSPEARRAGEDFMKNVIDLPTKEICLLAKVPDDPCDTLSQIHTPATK